MMLPQRKNKSSVSQNIKKNEKMKTISVSRATKNICYDSIKRIDNGDCGFEVLDNTIERLIRLKQGDGVYHKLKE